MKEIDDETLFYEPYRSVAHSQLRIDLEAGNCCECSLENGRKIIIVGLTNNIRELQIQNFSK